MELDIWAGRDIRYTESGFMISSLVMGIPPILQSCVSCKKWTKWNLNDVQHIWLKPPITVLMEYSWGPTDHLHFIAMIQLWQHLWLQPIKLSVRGNSCWIFNHNKLPCVFSVNISCFISIIYSSPLLIPLPCLNICWKSMKRNSYLVSGLHKLWYVLISWADQGSRAHKCVC